MREVGACLGGLGEMELPMPLELRIAKREGHREERGEEKGAIIPIHSQTRTRR